jgi:hypothetical protein
MITVHTRHGEQIAIKHGAAVTFAPMPGREGETPALLLNVVSADGRVLAAFRKKELAGWDLSAAGAGVTPPAAPCRASDGAARAEKSMSETVISDRIIELQRAIKDALPEESRHLVGELEYATGMSWTGYQDRIAEAIRAHLPHRDAEIRGAYEHVMEGDADPTLETGCER